MAVSCDAAPLTICRCWCWCWPWPSLWCRTTFGAPDLSRIQSLEIHADTWGYGFTLWLDGITFDPPLRPVAKVRLETGTIIMNWPASHPALILERAREVTGPFQPMAYTPAQTNGMAWVELPRSEDQSFFRLKIP